MSKSDTWMPLYIGDYLADTMDLRATEHGVTLLLMMHQWKNGSIPDDEAKLRKIVRVEGRAWKRVWGTVSRLFPKSGDGFRQNERLAKKRIQSLEDMRRLTPDAWKALRQTVFARDDYTCAYCGKRGTDLECDHVHPISRGGTNHPENLVTSCRPCNRRKGSKTVEEWRQ